MRLLILTAHSPPFIIYLTESGTLEQLLSSGIIPLASGKSGDEISCESSEETIRDFVWNQGNVLQVTIWFVSMAYWAAFDICFDKVRNSRPPVVASEEF